MTWTVEWDERARKELRKLGKQLQQTILEYLRKRIAADADPRRFGKPLSYDKHGLWRYRVQDARIVCRIEEDELLVLVVKVGHRKDIYNF
ncbi:MAG: type II toxin-antitoxin system RelE/ParE family toxin [Gammaproteobacteria bacterium]